MKYQKIEGIYYIYNMYRNVQKKTRGKIKELLSNDILYFCNIDVRNAIKKYLFDDFDSIIILFALFLT